MTDQEPTVVTDGQAVEPLSISDQFIGILSEPAATYENVRDTGGKARDWIVPLAALVVIILAGTLIRFSDPNFLADIREKQEQAMQEQVETGAMTQEQADQATQQLEAMGGMQKIISAIGVVLGVPFVFFLLALLYWVLVKFALKGTISYVLVLSVCGLTAYISVIDQLVSILLGYVTGNFFATFSPALFMQVDLSSSVYKVMSNLNPITIWSYYVLSIGFHVVAHISKAKAFGLVFGLWLLYVVGASMIKLPFGAM